MDILDYLDFRKFISDYLTSLPKRGRGELSRLSHVIGVQPSYTSMVLKGDRVLSSEKALLIAQHLGLDLSRQDYFVALVEWDRAGSVALKGLIERRLELIRQSSRVSSETRVMKVGASSEASI